MESQSPDCPVSLLRTAAATAGVLLSHVIALLVLAAVAVGVLGQYEALFAERGVMLPDATLFALMFHRWMSAYWYLLVIGFAPDGIIYFALARLRPSWNWLAAVWAVVPLLLTIIVLGVIATGMGLPLRHLVAG